MTVLIWFLSLFTFIGVFTLLSQTKYQKLNFWLKAIAAIIFIISPTLFSTSDSVVYIIINIIFVFIIAAS